MTRAQRRIQKPTHTGNFYLCLMRMRTSLYRGTGMCVIINHRCASIFEGRHIVTSIVYLRKAIHRSSKVATSIFESHHIDFRRSKAETSHLQFATVYLCVYALVGGAISIRDPYICAVSRVCANESHAVFHWPVVCAVKT